jgi:hypothetical protein
MAVTHLFAGIPVTNCDAAAGWFAGRPPDTVSNEDEAAWQMSETDWIYIVADAERASAALHAMLVEDLDEFLNTLTERGISVGSIETIGNAVRAQSSSIPDGNRLKLG